MPAFAFRMGEPVGAEARRIAADGAAIVLGALELAQARADQRESSIHDARRTLKRLRALVRLMSRDRGLTRQLRDAARPLATARDAAVIVRTFDKIAGDGATSARVRAELASSRASAQQKIDPRAVERVRLLSDAVASWQPRDGGYGAIEPGLRKLYRSGRRALREAQAHEESDALHTLRKRCKDLQHSFSLLRAVWPPVVGGYADAAGELAELLGDEHDYFVLRSRLSERTTGEEWLDRVDKKRRKLKAQIFPLAARLYADSTSTFVERVAVWWNAANAT